MVNGIFFWFENYPYIELMKQGKSIYITYFRNLVWLQWLYKMLIMMMIGRMIYDSHGGKVIIYD